MEGQLHLCLGSNRSEKRVGEGRLLSLCTVGHTQASPSFRSQCRLPKASLDHTVRPSHNKKEREDSVRFTTLAEILEGRCFPSHLERKSFMLKITQIIPKLLKSFLLAE